MNRGGIADLQLLRTLLALCQKSWERSFWGVMDSFVSLAYASLATSRSLLQRLLACLNFTLDSEDLFCWYKRKNVISMSSWKPWGWVRLDLIFAIRDIYINSNLKHSQNLLAAAEALNLIKSSHETTLKWSRRMYQSARE